MTNKEIIIIKNNKSRFQNYYFTPFFLFAAGFLVPIVGTLVSVNKQIDILNKQTN